MIRGDELYASYYSGKINQDLPWILCMIGSTDVLITRTSISAVASCAPLKSSLGFKYDRLK